MGDVAEILHAIADVLRSAQPVPIDVQKSEEPEANVDIRFLFEIVERVHDRVLSGIDVLDNVLIAIVAAVGAVITLAIDKLNDLGPIALGALIVSMACCLAGWIWGRWTNGGSYLEVPRIPTFISRVAEAPEAALVETIDDFRLAITENRKIRRSKGLLAWLAAFLLFTGTCEAGFPKVVQYFHDLGQKGNAKSAPAVGSAHRQRNWPRADADGA